MNAEALMAARARTFRFASLLLPREVRAQSATLYAFCRLVDDLADDSPSTEVAREALQEVRAEVVGHRPARPVVRDAMAPLRTVRPALDLVEGALSDQGIVRMQDDAQLIRYCYAVAGTVGWMMCEVLGVRSPRALPHAIDLGIAMQLTNICRDVAEDARMGRVYLPAERLRAAGESPERLVSGTAAPGPVARVVDDLLEVADRYYESAEAGMRFIPLRARLGVLVAARAYRGIGQALRSRGCDPLQGRVVVPLWQKLLYAVQATLVLPFLPRGLAHRPELHHALARGLLT